MWYLDEALNKLKNFLTEDIDKNARFYDSSSGITYQIKDGKFVAISDNKSKESSSNQGQQDQNNQDNNKDRGNKSNQSNTEIYHGPKKKGGSSSPTIGDKGNEDIQELEDLLRELQDINNQLGRIDDQDYMDDESDINDISDEIIKQSDDLKDKIKELKDELERKKKELQEKGGQLTDPEEDRLKKRADHIKEVFDDVQVSNDLMKETSQKVFKSREEKRRGEKEAKDREKLASMSDQDVINMLKRSLNNTLKSEIEEQREETWSKYNRKAQASGILRKGTRINEKVNVPSINVYFDRSGSWGPEKSAFGYDALSSISYLQKKGLIYIRIYYFNYDIMSSDPGYGNGGTRGTPILQHIKETKPDNVLIMTDDDIYDCKETVTVPGAVWLLFKGYISENLREHIKGRKNTKVFFIK